MSVAARPYMIAEREVDLAHHDDQQQAHAQDGDRRHRPQHAQEIRGDQRLAAGEQGEDHHHDEHDDEHAADAQQRSNLRRASGHRMSVTRPQGSQWS